MKKESFVLYDSYADQIGLLSNEQAGRLFKNILAYQNETDGPEMDDFTRMAFEFIRSQLDRDAEKYEEICQKRAEAGSKGGKQKVANQANATKCEHYDNDIDNDLKRKNKQKRKVNSFDNFPQRVYNMAELDKQLRG